jgi:hypothetical protein
MVKKIFFFSSSPITKKNYKRYHAKILRQNQFEVKFYDLSPIVFPLLYENRSLSDQPDSEDCFVLEKESEALQAIRSFGNDCFVIMVGYCQRESLKVFQALSQTDIPYAVIATETRPSGLGGYGGSLLTRIFFKLYNFRFNKLKKLFYKIKSTSALKVRPPNICILGGEKSLEFNGGTARVGDKTELLWTHSHDYNDYLERLEDEEADENIAVFIDTGSSMFLWDHFLPNRRTCTTVEKYYPSLCRFFDYVEKELGLKVIIAANPKSNHVEYPEYFGKRRTLRDQTHRLIKKSKLVISYLSSTLNYVILEKKPWILMTTEEYAKDRYYSWEIKMEGVPLGKTPVNIDIEPYSIDWKKELVVNEELYLNYKQLYIKKEGSEEQNTWQVVANRLHDF